MKSLIKLNFQNEFTIPSGHSQTINYANNATEISLLKQIVAKLNHSSEDTILEESFIEASNSQTKISIQNYNLDTHPIFNTYFPISTINSFIGENNSGKSRFLRDLFLLIAYNQVTESYFELSLPSFKTGIERLVTDYPETVTVFDQYQPISGDFGALESRKKAIDVEISNLAKEYNGKNDSVKEYQQKITLLPTNEREVMDVYKNYIQMYEHDKTEIKNKLTHKESELNKVKNAISEKRQEFVKQFEPLYLDFLFKTEKWNKIEALIQPIYNFNKNRNGYNSRIAVNFIDNYFKDIRLNDHPFDVKNLIYIPTLRGLRKLNGKDIYFERTLIDYFNHQTLFNAFKAKKLNDKSVQIVTGLDFYDEIKERRNGNEIERKVIQDLEKYLSILFHDETVELIPRVNEETLYLKIGKFKERAIYDLGDGIQPLLIIILSAFLYSNPDHNRFNNAIFIEEPELHLHYEMQRQLYAIMLDLGKRFNIKFFVTSHSNSFIEESKRYLDYSTLYYFLKDKHQFRIKYVDKNFESIIHALGYKNMFMATKKTLLVPHKRFGSIIKAVLDKRNVYLGKDYEFFYYNGEDSLGRLDLTCELFHESDDPTKSILKTILLNTYTLTLNTSNKRHDLHNHVEKFLSMNPTCKVYHLDIYDYLNIFKMDFIFETISKYKGALKIKDYDLSELKYDKKQNIMNIIGNYYTTDKKSSLNLTPEFREYLYNEMIIATRAQKDIFIDEFLDCMTQFETHIKAFT